MFASEPAPVVGRFAPSPTGPLHAGSMVAAVASYLSAKSQGGQWLLRIEDLDCDRTHAEHSDSILHTLEQAGLHWDGSILYQSRNQERYQAVAASLLESGQAYYCTCSRSQLRQRKLPLGLDGAPVYDGHCRDAGPQGFEDRGDHAGRSRRDGALRLRIEGTYRFLDTLAGEMAGDLSVDCGDFVIRRRDGVPAYMLACPVDDIDTGVTEVVRGTDILGCTPKQIALWQALGATLPAWTHIPLVRNSTGQKLSKQTGAQGVKPGQESAAVQQALVFLGCNPPDSLAGADAQTLLQWGQSVWQRTRKSK